MLAPWKKNYDQSRQHIKKQRHYFPNKGPSNQSYGFSSSHVWMWDLDDKESWALKNWCFWTVVLEKTLESPLDTPLVWQEIKLINPKGNQSWIFIRRTDTKAEAPILLATWWEELTQRRSWRWERWRREKGMTEGEVVEWHHWFSGHEFEQAPGVGDGQESLACCSLWGYKVRHDWATELNWGAEERTWPQYQA